MGCLDTYLLEKCGRKERCHRLVCKTVHVCVCVTTLYPRVFSSLFATNIDLLTNSQGAGAWIAGLPLTKTPAFHGDVFRDAGTCTCNDCL